MEITAQELSRSSNISLCHPHTNTNNGSDLKTRERFPDLLIFTCVVNVQIQPMDQT